MFFCVVLLSFGVVLWELLTGCEPYKDENVTMKKMLHRELKLMLPDTVSESYKQLFSGRLSFALMYPT